MKTLSAVIILLIVSSWTLGATPVTYFGQDTTPSLPVNQGGPNQVPRLTAIPNAQAAANRFLSRLPGAAVETFEAYTPGTAPATLTFGTDTAALSSGSTLKILDIPTGTEMGIFPITSDRCLPVEETFSIDFSSPQAAFGFFATDVEVATMTITLVSTNGNRTALPVPSTIPQGSGGVLFFGVVDTESPFIRVEFSGAGALDGYGFDDMAIARKEQVYPEQASLDIDLYAGLQIAGTVGGTYRIDYANALPSTNWTTLTNLVLPSSPYLFIDTETPANHMKRFYRAVSVK